MRIKRPSKGDILKINSTKYTILEVIHNDMYLYNEDELIKARYTPKETFIIRKEPLPLFPELLYDKMNEIASELKIIKEHIEDGREKYD